MEYLDYYGLDFDPFELPVDAIFSNAGGRMQLLEKVEHLVAFSELNIFVYGQKGIGKTNFLKHLSVAPTAMWRSIYLPVTSEFKFDDILKIILAQYHLSLTQNSSLRVVAAEISEVLQSSNQSVLFLCFDDAHLLPNELFNQILELKKEFEKFEVQIKILFAGEQSELEDNCDYAEDENQSYHLFLEPLSLEDTKTYLTSYFQKAGKSEKLPISASDIKRIFEMSQGIPHKINVITPEYLIQTLDQPITKMGLPFLKVGLGLGCLVVLIALFYYKQSVSVEEDLEPQAKEKNELLSINESVLKKLEAVNNVIEIEESLDKSLDIPEKKQMDDLEIENVEIEKEAEFEKIDSKIDQTARLEIDVRNELDTPLELKNPALDLTDESEIKLEKTEPIVVGDEINEPLQYTEINNWFRFNSGWVLQVLGSHNEKSVDDFISQYPEYDWHKYQRILNDKNYFVAVLGSFESKVEAALVLSKTPPEITKLDPWNRSIESIRPLLDH